MPAVRVKDEAKAAKASSSSSAKAAAPKATPFTKEEDEALWAYVRSSITVVDAMKVLPHRAKTSVRARLKLLLGGNGAEGAPRAPRRKQDTPAGGAKEEKQEMEMEEEDVK